MDAARTLAEHHRIDRAGWRVGDLVVPIRTKVGVRGHPGVDDALLALAEPLRRGRLTFEGRVLDLTGAPAALPVWAARAGVVADWTVASTSAAAIAAARATLADAGLHAPVLPAHPWEVDGRFDAIVWRPPADRGVRRVAAELAAVAARLDGGGTAWLLQHKDEGAKRTEKAAAECFAAVDVVAREGGWRLTALRGPRPGTSQVDPWTAFEAPGGPVRAVVGAFAAEKVDPGTRTLLRALAERGLGDGARGARDGAAGRALDLGCGTGILARAALAAGARAVVAVDDDLAAVRSAAANLGADERARVVHADLTAGVAGEDFDSVWCNPPFHVGRQVVGALSRAFLAAAHEALRPGGEAWFVANRALPYEAELAGWTAWGDATPANERTFKVLWARRAG